MLVAIGLTHSVHSAAGYEAASIKPSMRGDRRRPSLEFLPGGRFRSTNMPLLPVLGTAYNIPFQSIEMVRLRMKGIPDWVLSEPFDIEATAEAGATAPAGGSSKARNERIRLMIQAVLADRLKLKLRRESVEMPVYALVVKPHGLKLQKAKVAEKDCAESAPFGGTGCHQFQGGAGRGIRGLAVDMADLALYVSSWSDRPIVDQTGVTGLYEVQTSGWAEASVGNPSRPESEGSSRLTLDEVLDGLGLKLVGKKAPIEVLVIEHVERPQAN